MTCQGLNRSLWVIPLIRFHGTDDGQLVHVPGDVGKNFGNLDSWRVGRNGSETAITLHIPTVDMADPAFQPDQDDSLSFGSGSRNTLSGRGQSLGAAKPQKVGETDTQKT